MTFRLLLHHGFSKIKWHTE